MSLTNAQLADRLCAASAALREARRRHVATFEVLIPHVFMADVLAYVGSGFRLGNRLPDAPTIGEVRTLLECLEEGMALGDRETRNVISMSFVSDGETEPFFKDLKPMMGKRLRAQAQGK